MSLYSHKLWKEFSKSVIELDGFKCSYCDKSIHENILQVHHKIYKQGLNPWEYPLSDCETVCKGCHASIHGKIKPKFGWEYFGDEDLGDLIGSCENCGSSIRYVFTIHHENWGTIEVGTYCCDNLTDSKIASNMMESNTKYVSRRRRFVNSIRWDLEDNLHKIKQGNFEINVIQKITNFYLKIHGKESTKKYDTLLEAKVKAFDVIENGELVKYLKEKNIPIEIQKISGRKKS